MMNDKTYVLLTSARNEESDIEKTLEAVISQTTLPKKWIIVSDGSTDRTDEIVLQYTAIHSFIKFIRRDNLEGRNFASKVHSLNFGYKLLENMDFKFIGNLDADISFCDDYYEYMMDKFEQNESLGIIGGLIVELYNNKFTPQRISFDSVAGATQFFRQTCFEECEGYRPLKMGGEDALIENMAKMKGWAVRTLPDIKVYHHGRINGSNNKILNAKFNQGIMFSMLGYHPLFFILRFLYRIKDKPFFIGSLLQIFGFFWFILKRERKPVPEDVIEYLRHEQLRKIKSSFTFLRTKKKINNN